jgi:hypothetical protein
MINKHLKKIIKETAEEVGLTEAQVYTIFESQFIMAKEKIEGAQKGSPIFPIILLRGLGKFIPTKKYITKRQEYERNTSEVRHRNNVLGSKPPVPDTQDIQKVL